MAPAGRSGQMANRAIGVDRRNEKRPALLNTNNPAGLGGLREQENLSTHGHGYSLCNPCYW